MRAGVVGQGGGGGGPLIQHVVTESEDEQDHFSLSAENGKKSSTTTAAAGTTRTSHPFLVGEAITITSSCYFDDKFDDSLTLPPDLRSHDVCLGQDGKLLILSAHAGTRQWNNLLLARLPYFMSYPRQRQAIVTALVQYRGDCCKERQHRRQANVVYYVRKGAGRWQVLQDPDEQRAHVTVLLQHLMTIRRREKDRLESAAARAGSDKKIAKKEKQDKLDSTTTSMQDKYWQGYKAMWNQMPCFVRNDVDVVLAADDDDDKAGVPFSIIEEGHAGSMYFAQRLQEFRPHVPVLKSNVLARMLVQDVMDKRGGHFYVKTGSRDGIFEQLRAMNGREAIVERVSRLLMLLPPQEGASSIKKAHLPKSVLVQSTNGNHHRFDQVEVGEYDVFLKTDSRPYSICCTQGARVFQTFLEYSLPDFMIPPDYVNSICVPSLMCQIIQSIKENGGRFFVFATVLANGETLWKCMVSEPALKLKITQILEDMELQVFRQKRRKTQDFAYPPEVRALAPRRSDVFIGFPTLPVPPGNLLFTRMLWSRARVYRSVASWGERAVLAREICQGIQERGGRFFLRGNMFHLNDGGSSSDAWRVESETHRVMTIIFQMLDEAVKSLNQVQGTTSPDGPTRRFLSPGFCSQDVNGGTTEHGYSQAMSLKDSAVNGAFFIPELGRVGGASSPPRPPKPCGMVFGDSGTPKPKQVGVQQEHHGFVSEGETKANQGPISMLGDQVAWVTPSRASSRPTVFPEHNESTDQSDEVPSNNAVAKRKYRTLSEKVVMCTEAKAAAGCEKRQSFRSFCRERDVQPSQLRRWRKNMATIKATLDADETKTKVVCTTGRKPRLAKDVTGVTRNDRLTFWDSGESPENAFDAKIGHEDRKNSKINIIPPSPLRLDKHGDLISTNSPHALSKRGQGEESGVKQDSFVFQQDNSKSELFPRGKSIMDTIGSVTSPSLGGNDEISNRHDEVKTGVHHARLNEEEKEEGSDAHRLKSSETQKADKGAESDDNCHIM